MFERIVVGTDGSETAAEAVRQAAELASVTGAELEIVSAFEPVPAERQRAEVQGAPPDIQHALGETEDVNLVLEAASGVARRAGVEARTHARRGEAASAILDAADELGADLIVVGNRGMTGAARFLLGSVPNKVSHHASCGVLIARTT